jgi:hypothetical protein
MPALKRLKRRIENSVPAWSVSKKHGQELQLSGGVLA